MTRKLVATPSPATVERLHRDLLVWYGRVRRPLPWRRRPDPYGTWVAEIMLQQTTVAAVIPYWERFLARWPDVRALAAAAEPEVLALWSGLGYYRRARDLHRAARQVVAAGGTLPREARQWRALPGIGAYSAGAIASIAGGEAVPAVDANARRVLRRLACGHPSAARELGPAALERLAASLVPPEAPGQWNQALMELGALLCLPKAPRCQQCPVAADCAAARAGRAGEVGGAEVRARPAPVVLSLLVARAADGILLGPAGGEGVVVRGLGEPARSGAGGLFGGLWSPPATSWHAEPGRPGAAAGGLAEAAVRAAFADAWLQWLRSAGWPAAEPPLFLGEVRHAITRWRLRVLVAGLACQHSAPAPPGWRWFRPEAEPEPPLSALARKALARALQTAGPARP